MGRQVELPTKAPDLGAFCFQFASHPAGDASTASLACDPAKDTPPSPGGGP